MAERELVASPQPRTAAHRRPGSLVLGAIFLLLAGGALGYLLRPATPAGPAAQSAPFQSQFAAQLQAAQGQGSIFYGAVAALAALLVLALVRSSRGTLPWPLGRSNRFAGRAEKPAAEFVQEAKARGISLRVAREAYHLLQHHYPRPMCIDMNDDLRRDLRMTPGNILSLRSGLLGRTDRLERGTDDDSKIATVRQLLESVEAAPRNGVDRAKLRQRVTDLPFAPRPVVENIEFTAESELADPDFMRRKHFQWLRRRSADYKGFRSRQNDAPGAQTGHQGPFRRASELSRRLAVRQEAGRLAKEVAAKQAATSTIGDADFGAPETAANAYHGY